MGGAHVVNFLRSSVVLLALTISAYGMQQGDSTPSKADIRRHLAEIDLYHATGIDDYLSRIAAIEKLVPSMDQADQIADRNLTDAEQKYAHDRRTLRTIRAYKKLNSYDKEGLNLLKDEIKKAERLRDLPHEKQQAYFDAEIAPLRSKQLAVGQKEVKFARVMKQEGLALPQDVSQSIE